MLIHSLPREHLSSHPSELSQSIASIGSLHSLCSQAAVILAQHPKDVQEGCVPPTVLCLWSWQCLLNICSSSQGSVFIIICLCTDRGWRDKFKLVDKMKFTLTFSICCLVFPLAPSWSIANAVMILTGE